MEWQKTPRREVVRILNTDKKKGLSSDQVAKLLERDGLNLTQVKPRTRKYLKYSTIFGCTAIPFFAAIALCFTSAFLPSWQPMGSFYLDNVYLGGVLVFGAFIITIFSIFLEKRSFRISRSVFHAAPRYATVVRNGEILSENIHRIVVGDVVLLKPGDLVPADIRITDAFDLKMDEYALTYNSEPQEKNPHDYRDRILESPNIACFGSFCVQGLGKGIVVSTGDRTAMVKFGMQKMSFQERKTPLYIEMRRFILFMNIFAWTLGIILYICSSLIFPHWFPCLLYILVLTIANMPEFLISGVTGSLMLSVKRLATKNTLAKDLETVERLGSTSLIICSKTWVLTDNTLDVESIWCDGKTIEAYNMTHGLGECTDSQIRISKGTREAFSRALSLVCLAKRKYKKHLVRDELIDPLDDAILYFLICQRVDLPGIKKKYRKCFYFPFSFANKFQLTIHEDIKKSQEKSARVHIISLKGAPEVILKFCSTILLNGKEEKITESTLDTLKVTYEDLMLYGGKVIGLCDREILKDESWEDYSHDNIEEYLRDFRFIGFVTLTDPIRPDASETIKKFRTAGIKVVLVTGSHPISAKYVAREVGIISHDSETRDELAVRLRIPEDQIPTRAVPAILIHGSELKQMSSQRLSELLACHSEIVFTRTTPSQKLRIVEAFQQLGMTVAITGVGFGDHAAVKRANIGIAMNKNSCELCKKEAQLILLDNRLSTLVSSIEEGRLIFENLRKSILYVMTCKFAQIVPYVLYIYLNIPLPMSAIFLLLIFLETEMLPAMTLLYEKSESDILLRQPRYQKRRELITTNFISKLYQKSYCQIGVTWSLAGIYSYIIVMAENGFMPRELLGIRQRWNSPAVNDLKDHFNQEWTYTARKNLEHTCQTAFFITIVMTQMFSLLICRTNRDSLWTVGMRNYAVNFSLIFQIILTAVLCYLPGTDIVLRTYPIRFIWWLPGIPFGIFLTAFEETRYYILRHSKSTAWVVTENY